MLHSAGPRILYYGAILYVPEGWIFVCLHAPYSFKEWLSTRSTVSVCGAVNNIVTVKDWYVK